MKKPTVLIIVIIAGVTAISMAYFGASAYLRNNSAEASTTCPSTHATHTAIIKNTKVAPANIHAKRCDRLTIINKDDALRMVNFGQHDHHVAYDGISEKRLTKDTSFTITLTHTGSFHFHDHLHDEVEATFSVSD